MKSNDEILELEKSLKSYGKATDILNKKTTKTIS